MIKLSGREASVVRAIDFATGSPGMEIVERTAMQIDDVVGAINGLLEIGILETNPPHDSITPEMLGSVIVDVNPAYTGEVRSALRRR